MIMIDRHIDVKPEFSNLRFFDDIVSELFIIELFAHSV